LLSKFARRRCGREAVEAVEAVDAVGRDVGEIPMV
jgi:hypothetical protein